MHKSENIAKRITVIEAVQLMLRLIKKYWFVGFVIVSYLFFSVYYMGPSVWDCKNTLYGFGDNTAGPVWKFGISPSQPPLGASENVTNFPVGENLYSPVNYSLSGQSVALWGSSKVFGAVCGYNVFNMFGFFVSALTMFGFVYALSRRKWIAWLSGYAVSFTPYYQMKVGGHPGYGFQALLIGVAWTFFNLVTKKRKRDIVYFSGLLAVCFYFDPYFSLLAAPIVLSLPIVWLVIQFFTTGNRNIVNTLKKSKTIFLAVALFLMLVTPLLGITISNSRQISTSVAAVRGNVFYETKACSNLPYEYAAPFVLHPIFERMVGKDVYVTAVNDLHEGFPCGIGEDTVGISITILVITLTGLVVMGWERLNGRRTKLKLGYDQRLVIFGMLGVVLLAAAISFPPVKLFGIIPTPSYAMLKITTTWRTIARLYVVVNFGVVTLFAIVLAFFSDYFSKYRKVLPVAFVLLFGLIMVEYQAFRPFSGNKLSTFSYKTDVPSAYNWLGRQDEIKTVAEYPLEKAGGESNAMAYYLSMQLAHKKRLFNGNIPTTKEEELRQSLKDISDPQTVKVLGGLGIDAVVVHGVDKSVIGNIDGLEVVYAAPQSKFNLLAYTPTVKNDNIVIAKVRKSKTSQMLALGKGFVRNTNLIKSATDWSYEAVNNSEINVVPIPGSSKSTEVQKQCFKVKIAGAPRANVTVTADSGVAFSKIVGSEYVPVQVLAGTKITLTNDKGYNMEIADLGCVTSQ